MSMVTQDSDPTDSPPDTPAADSDSFFPSDSPALRPAHSIPTAEEKGDLSWGDVMLPDRGRPLSARHKRLAQLASSGLSQKDIADQLGLTQSRVSILLSNSRILAEVERLQDRLYEKTIEQRFQDSVPAAMDVIDEIIEGRSEEIKPQLRLEAAKWLLEKTTGKATQTHEVRGNLFSELLGRLDQIEVTAQPVKQVSGARAEGEAPLHPEQSESQPERDQFDRLLDDLLPEPSATPQTEQTNPGGPQNGQTNTEDSDS